MRLVTSKQIPQTSISGPSAASDVMRQIAQIERKYQEELNRGFTNLSEGSFKSLRRQLPVTRQKVEWEKVGGYRVSIYVLVHPAYMLEANDCIAWPGHWGREAAVVSVVIHKWS